MLHEQAIQRRSVRLLLQADRRTAVRNMRRAAVPQSGPHDDFSISGKKIVSMSEYCPSRYMSAPSVPLVQKIAEGCTGFCNDQTENSGKPANLKPSEIHRDGFPRRAASRPS